MSVFDRKVSVKSSGDAVGKEVGNQLVGMYDGGSVDANGLSFSITTEGLGADDIDGCGLGKFDGNSEGISEGSFEGSNEG